jgi:hypothetical protein
MRVRIYNAAGMEVVLDGVEWIVHKNAVEGLTIHAPNDDNEDLDVQAREGQVFVMSNDFLNAYEEGHVGEGQVVWPAPWKTCGECGASTAENGLCRRCVAELSGYEMGGQR